MDKGIPHSEFLSWDEDSRDKVIAYLMEEGDRCQQCGTKGSEWEANRYAYVAEVHRCDGCYLTDETQDTLRGPDGRSMPGTKVKLVLNTPQKQAEMAEFARRMREGTQE